MLLQPVVASAQAQSQQATVSVDARFQNSRLQTLDLELSCKQGNPGSEVVNLSGDEVFEWKTGNLPVGGSDCRLTAQQPQGYSVSYFANGESQSRSDRKGCEFRRVGAGDLNQCRVVVTQDPVKLMVYLEWIGPSGEEKDVRVSLECESGDYSGYRYVNAGQPDGWEIRDIDPEGILCNVSEEVRDNFRPDIIDCQGLLVLPGKGEECTLINTKIVKRIEMLNRYGKIVMILLVLAVGLGAVKRFS
ncbi:MAG: hypothetical protein LJE74_05905 [Proteobacteria bacterium]|nr:hypothetical protein [Pseudomonadota bacterium]